MRWAIALAAALSISCSSTPPPPPEPTATRLPIDIATLERVSREDSDDSWYGIYSGGNKVGWSRSRFFRERQGPDAVYVLENEQSVRILDSGLTHKTLERLEFSAAEPFPLQRSRLSRGSGSVLSTIRLERTTDGYRGAVEERGGLRSVTVGSIDYTLADAFTAEMWFASLRQPGDRLRVRDFDSERLQNAAATYDVTHAGVTRVDGVSVAYYDSTYSVAGTEHSRVRLGADGTVLSLAVGPLELRLEPKNQAQDVDASANLFAYGSVPCDQRLEPVEEIASLKIEVVPQEGIDVATGVRQRALRDNAQERLYVGLGDEYSSEWKVRPADRRRFLRDTVEYPTNHLELRRLLETIDLDEPSEIRKVTALVELVKRTIADRYVPGTQSIPELLLRREGDCTEHARLFTTLARAAGLPSREVIGLVYLGDDAQAFGPHMWCEVMVGELWLPVDPTLGQIRVDATHLSLGVLDGFTVAPTVRPGTQFKIVEVRRN